MGINKFLDDLPNEKSEARLSARVPARAKETIRLAAVISGATETQFMAQAAYTPHVRLSNKRELYALATQIQ